eukprot:2383664-Karenia_brevis.AAC.1
MLCAMEAEAHKRHLEIFTEKKERGSFNNLVKEAKEIWEEETKKSRESILDVHHAPLPSDQKWASKSEAAYVDTIKKVDDQLKK